jgi:hypothetical protein
MPIIGVIFFALGVLMAVFHRPVGIGFCRLGKSIWSKTDVPIARDMAKEMIKLYDEKKAPRIMLLLGIVFAVQGIALWFLPRFTQ